MSRAAFVARGHLRGVEMRTGRCQGCGERVTINLGTNGHGRSEHHPSCRGDCRQCPVQVLCGLVDVDPEDGDVFGEESDG